MRSVEAAVRFVEVEDPTGIGGAAHQVRQVRGGIGDQVGTLAGLVVVWAVDAVDDMATCALRLEDGHPGDGGGVGGLGDRLQLLVDPGLEVGRAERHGLHLHPGVRKAAELGALAEVDARLIGGDLPVGDATWDGVALAVQGRNPVTVDDVAAGDLEFDLLTGRDHQLVGRDDVGRREVAWIGQVDAIEPVEVVAVLPPPLLADYHHRRLPGGRLTVDGQRHGIVLAGVEVGEGRDGEHPDHDEDQRRHEGPEDLEAEVAVDLFRILLVAVVVAEPPPQVAGAAEDDHEHDAGNHEDRV